MSGENLAKLEQLCRSSIEAGIKRLSEVGTWPRPPRARNLRVGHDFHRDDLEDIKEVNNLLQYLASDDKIKSIYFQQSSTPELHILYDYWEQLLLKILRETEGKSLTNRVFKKWFRRFLKELYSDTAVWRSVDTITGLTLKGAKLKLDNATVLTSISAHRWLEIMQKEQQYDATLDWEPIGLDKASIITTVSISKLDYASFLHPSPYLTKHIERHLAAINAIRLTKPGAPRLHCFAEFQLSDFPVSNPLAYCNREGHLGLYEKEAIIERGDFLIIRNLWREFMDTKYKDPSPAPAKPNPMDTAFARFSRTYGRQNWLDDIADLTISLESLFNPTDREELKHRVSLRAAWLLSSDESLNGGPGKGKNIIYDRVRDMYDIRSCRVHGRTPKASEIRNWVKTLSGVKYDESKDLQLLELALESARDIVRKAIAACAKLSKLEGDGPKWAFPERFDENIVIASQRRVWQKAAGIKKAAMK
jgi:hypothetical protein